MRKEEHRGVTISIEESQQGMVGLMSLLERVKGTRGQRHDSRPGTVSTRRTDITR